MDLCGNEEVGNRMKRLKTLLSSIGKKLKSRGGESLTEVLVSVLISAVALTMLASMISASTGMVKQSREKLDDYYTNNNGLVNGLVTRTGTSVSGFAEFSNESGTVLVYDQVSYLENDESIGHAVIAYWKATS